MRETSIDRLEWANWLLVTALSAAAGIAKILPVQQEVDLFASAGLGAGSVLAFGVLQLSAAALLMIPKTRVLGAMLAAVMFLTSALILFIVGRIAFGSFSILPVLMATVVMRLSAGTVPPPPIRRKIYPGQR